MRTLPLFAIIALAGCKTVTLTEQQFFDPRPARLADSVRAAGHWPSPYTFSQGFLQSSDGARLFRVTLTRPSSDVAILYLGGSNFQIGQDYKRLTPLLETGATVFVADYPGYGESEGKPSLDSFEKAAVRYVAAQAIDHLSPKGSKEAAGKIRKVVDKNAEGGDTNFAGTFPLWDILFGTFRMPKGVMPEQYGMEGQSSFPREIIGQLVYPFRQS